MKILNNHKYEPIGRCIYCGGTENLEKEHILPFGLSGTAVLPQSSCRKCAAITGQVEQKLLQGEMWAVRVYRELKSRTKHKKAPKCFPLTIVKDGQEQQVGLPVEEFPILLHFPRFDSPAYLYPADYKRGIRLRGCVTISYGPQPEEVAKRLGAERIVIPQTTHPVEFARMIAKIAYAFAAAERKLDVIKGQPYCVPAILGQTDDIGRWVGTLTEPLQKHSNLLHRILIHEDKEKNFLIGEVQLFSDSPTPRYGVIIGQSR